MTRQAFSLVGRYLWRLYFEPARLADEWKRAGGCSLQRIWTGEAPEQRQLLLTALAGGLVVSTLAPVLILSLCWLAGLAPDWAALPGGWLVGLGLLLLLMLLFGPQYGLVIGVAAATAEACAGVLVGQALALALIEGLGAGLALGTAPRRGLALLAGAAWGGMLAVSFGPELVWWSVGAFGVAFLPGYLRLFMKTGQANF